MPKETRAQIYERLNSKAESMAQVLRENNPDLKLDDLVVLSAITIGHAAGIYQWKEIAHKLISDIIDSEET